MIAQPTSSQLSRRVRSIRHRASSAGEPDSKERRRRGAPCWGAFAALLALIGLLLLVALAGASLPDGRSPAAEASTAPAPAAHAVVASAAPAVRSAGGPRLHVALATDEEAPFGLLGVLNSTIVHCRTPRELRFHLILPNERRGPVRALLEGLFPHISFRTYSLDSNGVRAKITHHLRGTEREPLFLSPFRLAVAYLPSILNPTVGRVLWLHTDVLVFGDVSDLLLRRSADGAPAAAVQDCATPLSTLVDLSHASLASFSPTACSFDPAIMVFDLRQWVFLDVSSRVEYWLGANGRGGKTIFRHDAAFPPLLLALLPLYTRLPPEWGVSHAGRRRLRDDEISFWREHWAGRGLSYGSTVQEPVLVVTGGGAAGPRAQALHYHGRLKPWLLGRKQVRQSATYRIAIYIYIYIFLCIDMYLYM